MEQYLIVCPLVFLAGLIDSIAGGGGLISLPAYLIAGVPPHIALGTNKTSSSMGTVVSAAKLAKNGFVDRRTAVPGGLCAVAGAIVGATISLYVEDTVITHMMIVILPVVAFYVLRSRTLGESEKTGTLTGGRLIGAVCGIGLVMGIYDGFYGPGTGTFLLLLLTGLAHLDTRRAAGTTKVMNLSSNLAALATFLINGKVYYSLGLVSGLFCIAGHYIGSSLVVRGGRRVVRPMILVVLCILFGKLALGF
ncbi:MAG TPA: TSUP family transporter [Candidatus Lachnoclostridium stercoripullorum]|uniref:Probable membrane transporter protein n=1 Tax=Candidatus Lachnoclostridium stercoripullorum TaxID=2838635 RepID=A0A9D2AVP4_9FIRM|nr:TSUP family transporter [Candidatus Lachnoclostridium stercoripullorum]